MKKLFLILTLSLSVFVAAENSLQQQHDQFIQAHGDEEFLDGTHQMVSYAEQEISAYFLGQRCSAFTVENQRKIYRLIQVELFVDEVLLHFEDHVTHNATKYSLQYSIHYQVNGTQPEYQIKLIADDREEHAQLHERTVGAIEQYAEKFLGQITSCFQARDSVHAAINMFLASGSLHDFTEVTTETTSVQNTLAPQSLKTITKIVGFTKHTTSQYLDVGYPIVRVDSIRVLKGPGGVAFYNICPVPNILYLAGVVYNNVGSATVAIKMTVVNTPVPKKQIRFKNRSVGFSFNNTQGRYVDFGAPIARIEAIRVNSGLGGVAQRQIVGNQVYVTGIVYAKPGYVSVTIKTAVYE